jgi:hypothetical protein
MSRPISLLPLYAFMAWIGRTLLWVQLHHNHNHYELDVLVHTVIFTYVISLTTHNNGQLLYDIRKSSTITPTYTSRSPDYEPKAQNKSGTV